MKFINCLLFLSLGTGLLFSCSFFENNFNQKNGFRNFRIGSDKGDYDSLIFLYNGNQSKRYRFPITSNVKKVGGLDIYEKENENLLIGDIELDSIRYAFYKNKLAEIRLYLGGNQNNWNKVIDKYAIVYGPNFDKLPNGLGLDFIPLNDGYEILYFSKNVDERIQGDIVEKHKVDL